MSEIKWHFAVELGTTVNLETVKKIMFFIGDLNLSKSFFDYNTLNSMLFKREIFKGEKKTVYYSVQHCLVSSDFGSFRGRNRFRQRIVFS